jgi:cytochrome c-type biogenesis protein CcmH/NrfF
MDTKAKHIKAYYLKLLSRGLTDGELLEAFVARYGMNALDYASNLESHGIPY